jgi:hypothetical protein
VEDRHGGCNRLKRRNEGKVQPYEDRLDRKKHHNIID